MSKEQYNELRHDYSRKAMIDVVNERLNLSNIKQESIKVKDKETGEEQSISVDPIRAISDIVIY